MAIINTALLLSLAINVKQSTVFLTFQNEVKKKIRSAVLLYLFVKRHFYNMLERDSLKTYVKKVMQQKKLG